MKHLSRILALAVTATSSAALAQPPEEAAPVAAEPPSSAELQQKLGELLGRPGGLTAREAARRATADSPSVRRARTHIAVAQAQRTQALVGFFPRLTLSASYTRLSPIDEPTFGEGSFVVTSDPVGPLTLDELFPSPPLSFPVVLDQYLLQANLTVPVSDIALRTVHEYAATSHSRRAAEIEVEAAARGTAANAKIAYYDWVRTRMEEAVAEQTLAQAKVHLDAARALEAGGRASRADVMAAQAQLASSELLVQRAENNTTSALNRLYQVMRDTKAEAYEIGERLPTTARPLAPLREHYARAMRKRPELEILVERERALEKQRRAAIGATAPRLSAFGNVYYANPNQRVFPQVAEFRSSWDVGVQLSWSPNDVPGSLAQADVLEAQRAELVEQRAELRDTVRDEVRAAYFALRNARAALETTERGLAAAEEAYRVRAERFRFGRASAVELADSEADLFRARLERIDAQVGLRIAEVQLAHAVGD